MRVIFRYEDNYNKTKKNVRVIHLLISIKKAFTVYRGNKPFKIERFN
jgi:hypothetical protein